MQRYSKWILCWLAIAMTPLTAAFGQNYPFYYGHNYATHYVKDKNHRYWHAYSPDRARYFGDPGYEVYDDPDLTDDRQADSQAHYKGYDYHDDGFGYQYRPTRPLPQDPARYAKPDRSDVYGVGPDLFEPEYAHGQPVNASPRRLPPLRTDRSMDKYGRYRQPQ
jgi:hypothetical protein